MLFLVLGVSEFQVDQGLFASIRDKDHLLQLYDGMVFQVSDTLEIGIIYVGTSTCLVTISSTAESKRSAIRFFLLLSLGHRRIGHILDLVQTYLVFSDDNLAASSRNRDIRQRGEFEIFQFGIADNPKRSDIGFLGCINGLQLWHIKLR